MGGDDGARRSVSSRHVPLFSGFPRITIEAVQYAPEYGLLWLWPDDDFFDFANANGALECLVLVETKQTWGFTLVT